jgi:hypothetical protein
MDVRRRFLGSQQYLHFECYMQHTVKLSQHTSTSQNRMQCLATRIDRKTVPQTGLNLKPSARKKGCTSAMSLHTVGFRVKLHVGEMCSSWSTPSRKAQVGIEYLVWHFPTVTWNIFITHSGPNLILYIYTHLWWIQQIHFAFPVIFMIGEDFYVHRKSKLYHQESDLVYLYYGWVVLIHWLSLVSIRLGERWQQFLTKTFVLTFWIMKFS